MNPVGSSEKDPPPDDVEGIFPLSERDSIWSDITFIKTQFTEEDHENVITVIDLQSDSKLPLFLLFPDLDDDDKERLVASSSTTQVTKILQGKKAKFRFLKASQRFSPEQGQLPPLVESAAEEDADEGTEGEESEDGEETEEKTNEEVKNIETEIEKVKNKEIDEEAENNETENDGKQGNETEDK